MVQSYPDKTTPIGQTEWWSFDLDRGLRLFSFKLNRKIQSCGPSEAGVKAP